MQAVRIYPEKKTTLSSLHPFPAEYALRRQRFLTYQKTSKEEETVAGKGTFITLLVFLSQKEGSEWNDDA